MFPEQLIELNNLLSIKRCPFEFYNKLQSGFDLNLMGSKMVTKGLINRRQTFHHNIIGVITTVET